MVCSRAAPRRTVLLMAIMALSNSTLSAVWSSHWPAGWRSDPGSLMLRLLYRAWPKPCQDSAARTSTTNFFETGSYHLIIAAMTRDSHPLCLTHSGLTWSAARAPQPAGPRIRSDAPPKTALQPPAGPHGLDDAATFGATPVHFDSKCQPISWRNSAPSDLSSEMK